MTCAFTQAIWNNYEYGQSKKILDRFNFFYMLTPQGIADKLALTSRFIRRKMEKYEALQEEIKALKSEVDTIGNDGK